MAAGGKRRHARDLCAAFAFTATATYHFEAPLPSQLSEPVEVSLSDSLGGTYGPFLTANKITYTRPAACPANPGAYTAGVYAAQVANTAPGVLVKVN